MYDWLLGLLVVYPRAFIAIGRVLSALTGILALLGLRLDRVADRIAREAARAHLEAPDVLAGFPWWLRMAIPETAVGWAALVALLVSSVSLLHLGKWARKL